MAKPDMSILLGIKRKKPADEAPPPPPDMAPDDENDPGDQQADQITNDDAGGPPGGAMGGDLTPDMLDYHGGNEGCGGCIHFQPPTTCDRFPDPVEESGWCRGFQPKAQQAPNLGKMPGMPPGGPPGGPPPGAGMP